jgi:hypothetical protein
MSRTIWPPLLAVLMSALLVRWLFLDGEGALPPAQRRAANYSLSDLLNIDAEARELEAQRMALRRFEETFEPAMRDLREGRQTLAESAEVVFEAALRDWPKYLEHLRKAHSGGTDLERVARNLIDRLQTAIDTGELPADTTTLVRRLKSELRVLSPAEARSTSLGAN